MNKENNNEQQREQDKNLRQQMDQLVHPQDAATETVGNGGNQMTITLTREEAQQVLDALERGRSQIMGVLVQQDQDEAIETLRARLALHDMNKESERIGEEL